MRVTDVFTYHSWLGTQAPNIPTLSMNYGSLGLLVLSLGLVITANGANADYTFDPYDYFDGQNAQAVNSNSKLTHCNLSSECVFKLSFINIMTIA